MAHIAAAGPRETFRAMCLPPRLVLIIAQLVRPRYEWITLEGEGENRFRALFYTRNPGPAPGFLAQMGENK